MRFRREEGFTLIELMVVILLLTILALLAFALYGEQRAKATDVEAKQYVGNAVRNIEACNVEVRDLRECATSGELGKMGLVAGTGAGEVELRQVTRDTYIAVGHSATGAEFRIERAANGSHRSCDPPGEGGCHPGAIW